MKKVFNFGPRRPELILVDNGGLAAVIEGNRWDIQPLSDLSRSFISERFDARLHGAGINDEENAGRYSNTDERHIGRRRFGLSLRTVGATSWSGDSMAYWPVSAPHNTAPHCYRNHGNPYTEKGMHTRSQQIFLAGAGWVGSAPMLMRGMQPWPSVCIPQLLEAGRPA